MMAEEWLRQNANIEVELSDLYNILCISNNCRYKEGNQLLVNALSAYVKSV